MKTLLVGGAVRDALLSLPVRERDYLVIGSNPQQMLAQGFKPVGRDFPVFLHPQTHEEYALARTERKIGTGHQGFCFHADESVTLEEDLSRRDLTINAIAQEENGTLCDPFQGQLDLKNRVLRHVSSAFSEDPLRILRVARFRAYLGAFDFQIASTTFSLMQEMVDHHALDELSDERIWQELVKALVTTHPELFFLTLDKLKILPQLFTKLSHTGIEALIRAKIHSSALIRFAAAAHEGPYLKSCPKNFSELRDLIQKHGPTGLKFNLLPPTQQWTLLKHLDFQRRADRLNEWLQAAVAIYPSFPISTFTVTLTALKKIDRKILAAQYSNPQDIQDAIAEAELKCLEKQQKN